MTYCLVPMTVKEIESLVGKTFVKTFQKEMDEYLAPYRKNVAKGRPLSMGKELWEYAVADSIKGAEWCGAGKSIIDVRIGDKVGIDVKSVSKELTSSATTEASMFQSFKEETKSYFNKNDTKSIWDLFVDGWLSKVKSVEEYYLISIVREKETLNCSLCAFKVADTSLLYEDTLCKFTKKSMKVSGIADPAFIETRVYSSKTRLEIKFKNKVWQDSNYALPIYKF